MFAPLRPAANCEMWQVDTWSFQRLTFAIGLQRRLRAVKRHRIPSFGQHPIFSRVLSLLLLGFVVYGTTIAAAHRHGTVLDTDSGRTSAVSQPSGTSTLNGGQFGCNECVLCQLHQYSSTALIPIRTGITQLNTRSELRNPEPIFVQSLTKTPQKGRAPPFTS